jgi:hypothetical protein
MKDKKKIIIGASVIALSIVVYKLISRARAKKYIESVYSTVSTGIQGEFPLRYGSRGENVKKLQEYLNTKITPPTALLEVDGIFGNLTQGALEIVTGSKTMTKEELAKV